MGGGALGGALRGRSIGGGSWVLVGLGGEEPGEEVREGTLLEGLWMGGDGVLREENLFSDIDGDLGGRLNSGADGTLDTLFHPVGIIISRGHGGEGLDGRMEGEYLFSVAPTWGTDDSCLGDIVLRRSVNAPVYVLLGVVVWPAWIAIGDAVVHVA